LHLLFLWLPLIHALSYWNRFQVHSSPDYSFWDQWASLTEVMIPMESGLGCLM
jgi:hypothetical protein